MDATDLENKLTMLIASHIKGELSRGALLRTLRKDILQMNQTRYCNLVGIGRNALVDIERDQGEPTETVVMKAFSPFNLQPMMIRPDIAFLKRCLA